MLCGVNRAVSCPSSLLDKTVGMVSLDICLSEDLSGVCSLLVYISPIHWKPPLPSPYGGGLGTGVDAVPVWCAAWLGVLCFPSYPGNICTCSLRWEMRAVAVLWGGGSPFSCMAPSLSDAPQVTELRYLCGDLSLGRLVTYYWQKHCKEGFNF